MTDDPKEVGKKPDKSRKIDVVSFLDSPKLNNILIGLLIALVAFQTTRIITNQDELIKGQHRSDLNDVKHGQQIADIEQDIKEMKDYIYPRKR